MSGIQPPTASWQQLLQRYRQRRFVGRERELEAFQQFLSSSEVRLLHVCGPGGIGKTTLLERYESLARDRGQRTARVSARDLGARPQFIAKSLAHHGDVDLWLIDGLEHWSILDGWLRLELLPSLGAQVRVVTAGREPLSAEWLTDPGWEQITTELSLDGLSSEEARELLQAGGVEQHHLEQALEVAGGSPLLLLLAGGAATAARKGEPALLVDRLVARLVREAPTPVHEDALFLSALVSWVDDRVLEGALGDSGSLAMLEWLSRQPGFLQSDRGVAPHDRVREALRELMQRQAPKRARDLGRRAQHCLVEHIAADPKEGELAIHQLIPAFAFEPNIDAFGFGTHAPTYPSALQDSDHNPIVEAVGKFEGPESAALMRRWLHRYPRAFVIARNREGHPLGLTFTPRCDELRADDAQEPGFRALQQWLDTWLPSGHRGVEAMRTWMSLEHYMSPCTEQGCLAAAHWQHTAQSRHVITAVGPAGGEFDAVYEVFLDRRGPQFDNFGARFGWWAHDRRLEPPAEWLHRMCRVVRGDIVAPEEAPPEEYFQVELREALRRYTDDAKLADTELAQRLQVAPAERAAATRRLLDDLVVAFGTDGANAVRGKVLREAFMVPDQKQLAAASALNMSVSTLRRRITEGVEQGALMLPQLLARWRYRA